MHFFRSPTPSLLTLLLCCTSLLSQTTAAVAADLNLQARKNVDHNLVCEATLPTARTWPGPPATPPRSSFRDLLHLCARVAGQTNVGCLCDKPYTGVTCPDATSAGIHPMLSHRYAPYCLRFCECDYRPPGNSASDDEESTARQRAGLLILPRPILSAPAPPHFVISRALDTSPEAECGGSCSSVAQECSAGPGSTGQCKCTGKPLGGPHGSTVHFSGSCAAVHSAPSPAGRGRDGQGRGGSRTSLMDADETTGFFAANGDQIACPCNTTYVSYSCCESGTGIVWEAPDKKLGELEAGA